MHQFKKDLSALAGTLASLVAFAVMGWLIQEIMWRPVELRPVEFRDEEKAEPIRALEQPADPAPSRKATSHARLTA